MQVMSFLLALHQKIRSILPIALAVVVSGLTLRSIFLVYYNYSFEDIWDMDFFSIWSFAKFSLANDVSEIYNNSKLMSFQMDLGAVPRERPYAYPPSFILLILPLAFLTYQLSFIVWDVSTFLFYIITSLYGKWRISAIFLTIVAPATFQNFFTGQTGFLSAAFILGGFRLAASRPILSGTLFGLASFKPTLGILVPIALISARAWRSLIAAVATIGILVVASSLVFGWSAWEMWLAKLPAHADWITAVPDQFKPTITANLTFLGIDLGRARMVQLLVAVVVAFVIWVCFRRGVTLLATAALLVGTILATPYAFLYDLPILTNAVLMFIRHKDLTSRFLTIPEAGVLLLVLVIPVITLETWRPAMFRSVPLLLLFGIIVRDLVRFRSKLEEPRSEPVRSASRTL
jgi:Glycosyltransferase family 87